MQCDYTISRDETIHKAVSMIPRLEMQLQQNHEHDPLFNVAVECVKLNSSSLKELRLKIVHQEPIAALPYASMVAIKSALVKNSNLECLEFNSMDIGDHAGMALAEALKSNACPIKTLYVNLCSISLGSMRTIASALTKNQTIEVLNLMDNDMILDDSGVALAKALRENSTLEILGLDNTDIGDETCRELAESLRHNSTLEVLGLCECYGISEEGCAALANALEENLVVEDIDLTLPARQESRKLEFYLWLNNDCRRAKFLRNDNNVTRDQYVNNMIQSKYKKRMRRMAEELRDITANEVEEKCYDTSACYYWIRSKPSLCTTTATTTGGGALFTTFTGKRKGTNMVKTKKKNKP